MSDEAIQRSRLATLVYRQYGPERARADEELIASASLAIARLERLTLAATAQLDSEDRSEDRNNNAERD